jgi:hypothetical protein
MQSSPIKPPSLVTQTTISSDGDSGLLAEPGRPSSMGTRVTVVTADATETTVSIRTTLSNTFIAISFQA